ncbi:hypothetical protein PoB_000535700 [Plakobranchus ocellatus]|uniref:G-protein coupled receptors family 1 profile domain-containing protein n=1 Tax=Plakobranchus ocellatus TaxID=259542 RepID=A0AAV3Y8P9_9GAST|nr:hypothetical protein PoB_000535700 [Plakobranchus ocellatus]
MAELFTPTLNCSKTDITSQATLWMTSVVFRVYIPSVLSAFSLASNIINILVFSRMGLKDGATATFLVLSVSDGATEFYGLLYSILITIRYFGHLLLQSNSGAESTDEYHPPCSHSHPRFRQTSPSY